MPTRKSYSLSLETQFKLILLMLALGMFAVLIGMRLYNGYREHLMFAMVEMRRIEQIVKEVPFESDKDLGGFVEDIFSLWKLAPEGDTGELRASVLRTAETAQGHTVYFRMDAKRVWESLIAENKPLFVYGMLSMLAFLQIGALFAYSITRPLRRLDWGFSHLMSGHPVQIPRADYAAEELVLLTDKFNEMSAELTKWREFQDNIVEMERLATMGEMASGVAHEMRNPVASMKMQMNLLRMMRGGEDESLTEFMDNFDEELNNMGSKLEQFLDFARQDKPKRVLIDPIRLQHVAASDLEPVAEEYGILLRVLPLFDEEAEERPIMLGDPGMLKQVLRNVGLNGIYSMEDGGVLTMSLDVGYDKVVFTIEDTGCGIPEKMGLRIFEPFVTTRPDSSGLGLAIAKKSVVDHRGTIRFHSTKFGTAFTIELPLNGGED